MRAHIYLTVTKSGVVKMTKESPALTPTQRAVRLSISVPDSVFLPPPILDAQLDVPADRLAYPSPTGPVDVEIWEP